MQQSIKVIFIQLEASLTELTNEQFCRKIDTLSNAIIGRHEWHMVEMLECLQEGVDTGIENYEKRKSNITIETSKAAAIHLMYQISASLLTKNKDLILEAGFGENSYELNKLPTNYFREIH